MNPKDRSKQRDRLAPRGRPPAWLLVTVAGVVTVLAAFIARTVH
jgi:hypothetical protein